MPEDKKNSAAAKIKGLESTPYNTLVEHVDAAGWRLSFGLLQQRTKWLQNFMEDRCRYQDSIHDALLERIDRLEGALNTLHATVQEIDGTENLYSEINRVLGEEPENDTK